MRLPLFSLLLLLATAVPATAQPTLPAPPAAPDTAAALHRLFAHKRHVRNSLAIAGASVGVGGLLTAHNSYDLGNAAAAGVGLLGIPVAGASYLYYYQYSATNEALAVEACG